MEKLNVSPYVNCGNSNYISRLANFDYIGQKYNSSFTFTNILFECYYILPEIKTYFIYKLIKRFKKILFSGEPKSLSGSPEK